MKQFLLLMPFIAILFQCTTTNLLAQQMPPSWTDGTTESRLRSIYENNHFRAQDFKATWFEDSQGYSIRQRDPNSNNITTVHYDVRTGKPSKTKPPRKKTVDTPPLVSADGKRKLVIQNRNLFIQNLETGERTPLTDHSPDRDIAFRNLQSSPDGKYVAFIQTDHSKIKKRAMLIPSDPSYPGVREQRFARVGEAIPALRVGIVDIDSEKLQWLPIESPEEGYYLGHVGWAKGANQLLVERLSRFRDEREFLLASVDGTMKQIFHESDPAWVVASQAKNSGLVWVAGGSAFIVISEKNGWRQAYLYSREGQELSVVTPGQYDIIQRAVVDEVGRWYYFYASPDNATEKYLYRIPLDGTGPEERVTPQDQAGTHDYDFSPDRKWAFHTVSTFDTPPVTELIEVEGHRTIKTLKTNKRTQEQARSVVHRPTEFLQIDIGDGISMDAWMIKPKDFDDTKKYPIFVYVYGEPHAQTVLNEWGTSQSHFLRVIADLGYLVVSIDNRGTPAPKGAAWRRSIAGSLGPLSTEDQAAALKELGRMRSYVDLSRVGIWGWSGGGSNTLNAMFRKPEDYHVGIAVVPKPQPHLYNAWFQEIYMKTREVNPEGYKKSAPIHFAEGLEGKLLMVTGSGETNTHIQIIEGLVDRLIELGKPFDYMVYPNRNHGLREGLGTVVHVRMLITRFLLDNLPPGPR